MSGGSLIDYEFTCPYCWESISMLLDLSVPDQRYVEDCEVCCNPILVHVLSDQGELVSFSAERSD